ncbi:uncharacterized protein LOC110049923 [Orbicella faveolata]|uniref:uncharacterized protein LOC110049923 n=1 Tax=Orbicella faveolata TaxID=48498 RepID=UPI0009E1E69E|nr:uncharacterized protein LOC110049923 [Orbicella faveolata]XP_020611432.1 uncharacterized protein LOC110049923 [Orbicella faveolata]
MFLAVSLLLLGVGMVSSNPVKQQPVDPESFFWIKEEPRCEEVTDPNDTWLKHKNNICYNCECFERDALCKRVDVECPLTLSCPAPVIPPVEECKCPHCEPGPTTGPTPPLTIKITETEGTPTTEYDS